MTGISGITGTSSMAQMAGVNRPRHGPPGMEEAMTSMAQLVGMTGDELRSALQQGTTLSEVASSRGVSKDQLVSTLAEGLKSAAPADAPQGLDFVQLAEAIASGQPPRPAGMEGAAGGGRAASSALGVNRAQGLEALGDLLGIDASALRDGLESGTSLSDILAVNGIDERTLSDRFLTGMAVDTYV